MSNQIFIVGTGSGAPGQLTPEAAAAIRGCRFFTGAPRLLELAQELAPQYAAGQPIGADLEAVRAFIGEKIGQGDVCVLTSGDPGCFSILPFLSKNFTENLRVIPGISSVQLLAARLAHPWQDWRLVSLHGRGAALAAVEPPRGPTVYFCDEASAPHRLAERLLPAMPDCQAVAAQALGQEGERIFRGSLAEISRQQFGGNSLLLVMAPGSQAEAGRQVQATAPGIPDEFWIRAEGVPLSKSEVRAVLLSKAQPGLRRVIWDVGAGTGSYGIEAALLAPGARVIAIEKNPAACHLITANAVRLGAVVEVVCLEAPQGFEVLARPDLVIVGGNDGMLAPIVKAAACALNPGGRLAVTAFLEETKKTAHRSMAESGLSNRAATRVSIARGHSHEWVEHNPVVIFTGDKEEAD